MRPDQRLRSSRDFAAVYRQGRAFSDRLLVVRSRSNGGDATRFGFVAAKTVGGAVVRNRVKRRLRALADATAVQTGVDIVVTARHAASAASFEELRRSFLSLVARVGASAGTGDGERLGDS